MSAKNNPNINKLFNKLYVSFPSVISIDKSDEFGNMRYIYKTEDSSKWFVKYQNTNQEVFLFGKIKENIPYPPLLTLTFDKVSSYSKNCSGIINAENVYIRVDYFIDNYPNFRTILNETTIDIYINGQTNSINVIKLGDYVNNIGMFIDNINILLNELDEFEPIEEPKSDIDIKKNTKTCEKCGKELKNNKFKLCKKCSKKRHAADILVNLLKYVEPQTPFDKADLKRIYDKEIEIDDCIWSLEEFNLLNQKNNNQYCLANNEILTKFIQQYASLGEMHIKKEEKKEEPKKLNKKCSICKKTLPVSKFYKNKKTDDGLEDYCKKCKKYVNTANYLKEILNQVSPSSEFKAEDLKNDFKNPLEFNGRLWELQTYDLLIYDSDKEVYKLADLETCQNFLDSYYIQGSITINPEIKNETDVKELTQEQQMDCVIKNIKNGKTEKEAAEIAGINLYNITHWFNEGKNNSGEENINFYNRYIKAKKEAKINSYKNFYIIESFDLKGDLTIADTLRKQQMEKILKEIGSGSSLKTAAFNSGIVYETLQYWYKRGKQNFGEEYNEFYEKINILQSPINVPEPEVKKSTEGTEANEELPHKYKNILNPLPNKFKKIFKGAKESESGFAWVKKDRSSWRYDRQQNDNRQSIRRVNIYELYDEVIKRGYIWGVRDIKKAKETLKQSKIPNNNIEHDEEILSHILDPVAPEYAKRFKKPTSSGFAWVKKRDNSWVYNNKIFEVNIQKIDLYELYKNVKERNLPWGVRDLDKAKESLNTCNKSIKEDTIESSQFDENDPFKHILDPIPSEYYKRFRKPSSSGLSWVNKVNNTWSYTNPKDNVRIYDSNLYNLYLKVKKQNLPWGVRDLDKAKDSLSKCEKPKIQSPTPKENEINNFEDNGVSCICFEENNNLKIIVNGLIKNDEFMNTLYKFKPYEKNIKKIISNRHTEFTELFIEFELEKNRFKTFKDKINIFGWKIVN